MNHDDKQKTVFIGIATYRDVNGRTIADMWNSLTSVSGYNWLLSITSSANVGFNRNSVVKEFLESKAEYLLYLDQDMRFTPQDLKKIVTDIEAYPEAGVFSGLYIKRDGSLTPLCAWVTDDDPYEIAKQSTQLILLRDKRGEIVECHLAPTGFMIIRREVFDDISEPWFYTMFPPGEKHKTEHWSSDSVFCHNVRQAGWKIYMDLGIELGHIGEYVYYPEDLHRYIDKSINAAIFQEKKVEAIAEYGVNTAEYWDIIWKLEDEMGFERSYTALYSIVSDFVGQGMTVLDIGSGVGVLARDLDTSNKITCSDISDFALSKCKELGFETIELDIKTGLLPITMRNKFDVITCTETLEHIEDWSNFRKIIDFGLRPGGKLIVTCPNNCLGPDEEAEHVRRILPKDLGEFMVGFKDVQIGNVEHYLIGVGVK